MTTDPYVTISTFTPDDIMTHTRELGGLLHDCVHAGASIGFVLPFTQAAGEAFWIGNVLPAVRDGTRLLLVAHDGGRIAGAVQLDYDTPPNGRHRAEVRKLIVHPDLRRRGIARALMVDLERRARSLGRTLLTLDTRTGDKAEPLYASLGYVTAGVIPGFARDAVEERLDATTIMYKIL